MLAGRTQELGLSPDRLTVLISFGGKGLGAEKHINMLRVLLKLALPLQFIIITGENRPFEIKLREREHSQFFVKL